MTRDLVFALAGGAVSALFCLSLLFAAPLPLFMIGLGLGLGQTIVAGAAVVGTSLLVSSLPATMFCAAVLVIPALALVRQTLLARPGPYGDLEWYPAGYLAVWVAGIGAALVILAIALIAGYPQGAEGWVRDNLTAAIRQLGFFRGDDQVAAVVDMLAPMAPGLAVAMWQIMLVANGALAQRLMALMGRNLRPQLDLAMFRLPHWMLYAAAATLALALAGQGTYGYLGWNLMIVVLIPFFLTGVAVVHVISRNWPQRPVLLAIFYAALLVFGWPMSIILMMLGVVEHWIDLRRRMAGTGGPGPGAGGPGGGAGNT